MLGFLTYWPLVGVGDCLFGDLERQDIWLTLIKVTLSAWNLKKKKKNLTFIKEMVKFTFFFFFGTWKFFIYIKKKKFMVYAL